MNIQEKTVLEIAFAKFDTLMEKYNEAITSTEDEKEQEKIQKEYDTLIDAEEKALEEAVQLDFKTTLDGLAKEEAELALPEIDPGAPSEEEIKVPAHGIKEEVLYLKSISISIDELCDRYLKNKNTQNGFSTVEIYKYLGGTGNGNEKELAKFILDNLNNA